MHDRAPAPSTGVPIERDPVTGKPFPGDPTGRGDKYRRPHSRGAGKAALIAAATAVVAGGAVLAVFLFRSQPPLTTAALPTEVTQTTAAPTTTPTTAPSAPAPTTTRAPAPKALPVPAPPPSTSTTVTTTTTTTTSTVTVTTPPEARPPDPQPAPSGPITIPVLVTTVEVTPPPGFEPDPSFGSPGDQRSSTWLLTGPCDGTGPCEVQMCATTDECDDPFTATPTPNGYTATLTGPVDWHTPNCTGGEIVASIRFTLTGDPAAPTLAGTWVESADPVVLTMEDESTCGIYLAQYEYSSM